MRRGDADAFKAVFNFLDPSTPKRGRSVKVKRGPAGDGSLETSKRLCQGVGQSSLPPLSGDGGREFYNYRITDVEIVDAPRAVQVEVKEQSPEAVEVGTGIDAAELSRWISCLGLRPYMRESDERLAKKAARAQAKKDKLRRDAEELEVERKLRRKPGAK